MTTVESVEEVKPAVNEETAEEDIKIEDTKISSGTREIDVSTVNNLIKDATQELMTTKLKNNFDETQIIEPITSDLIKENLESTQVINTKEIKDNESMQETKILKAEEKNALPQNTLILENKEEEEKKAEAETEVIKSDEKIEVEENSFDAVAEKLIKAKMDLNDNTQMIDTQKIREALKEEKITIWKIHRK